LALLLQRNMLPPQQTYTVSKPRAYHPIIVHVDLSSSCVWRCMCGGKQCVQHFKDGSMGINDLPAQSAASIKMMH